MSAEHKSVARALAYVLHLGDTDAWFNFSTILKRKLEPEEIAGLAYSALRCVDPEYRRRMYELLGDAETPAGSPLPPLSVDVAFDARWWAGIATETERKAYIYELLKTLNENDKKIVVRNLTRGRT